MKTIVLYRYTRTDGGTTVSTVKPDVEFTQLYRLLADEGMVLTNGEITTICVDTEEVSVWSEIVDVQSGEVLDEHVPQPASTPELTEEILAKARAYDELMQASHS